MRGHPPPFEISIIEFGSLLSITQVEGRGITANGDHDAWSSPRWRPSWLTFFITILALAGMTAGLYPMTASWLSSYNQSKIVSDYTAAVDNIEPSATEQLQLAHEYNEALTAGVVVGAHQHIATGTGTSANETLEYSRMLRTSHAGMMSRVKIPALDVDLPIYHGTSEETLLKGAGHLEGSHLPIGGTSTRSVITAHRGLASSTMFTNLDKVVVGDTFTLETFGEVLAYKVRETQVIAPDDTDTLKVVPGEDLVTLITCTPLGINTHRILVTGERITPTPPNDLVAVGAAPTIPGFPWWIVIGVGGLSLATVYFVRRGYVDARLRHRPLHVSNLAAESAVPRVLDV